MPLSVAWNKGNPLRVPCGSLSGKTIRIATTIGMSMETIVIMGMKTLSLAVVILIFSENDTPQRELLSHQLVY